MAKTKLTVKIHNVETGEVIERDMTAEEILEVEAKAETDALLKAEAESKAAAKQAIADRLGLTADELKLLLG